jgi:mannose-6-phosphate isomerase-like protein (cupin superfamily)
MTLTQPFVIEPDDSDRGPWKVLAPGSLTGGAVMFGDARIPPKTSGPSLHVHTREDEATYVIAGVLTFTVGDRTFEATSGTLVWLPREVPHTFANLSDDPVWAFGVTLPGGLEGMFAEQAEYFAGLEGPPDEDVVSAIGAKYGVRVVGPPLTA